MKRGIVTLWLALAMPAVLALATPAAVAIASLPVGSTAQVTISSNGQSYSYTGILVRPNELAPCYASSAKQDVVLTGSYTIVAWPRPCPQLPLALSASAVGAYLRGGISLLVASSS
jgi:hypothetical protein